MHYFIFKEEVLIWSLRDILHVGKFMLDLLDSIHHKVKWSDELHEFLALLIIWLYFLEKLLDALIEIDQKLDQSLRMNKKQLVFGFLLGDNVEREQCDLLWVEYYLISLDEGNLEF